MSNREKDCYLDELSFKNVKKFNENVFYITKNFVDELFEKIFSDVKKYVIKESKLDNQLRKIYFECKKNCQDVDYFLDLSENEQIKKIDGNIESYRYYDIHTGIKISDLLFQYRRLWFKNISKELNDCLTDEGKKEKDKILNMTENKLTRLQDELIYLIANN